MNELEAAKAAYAACRKELQAVIEVKKAKMAAFRLGKQNSKEPYEAAKKAHAACLVKIKQVRGKYYELLYKQDVA